MSSSYRGYCGIGIVAGKTPDNVGGLWRSAHAFDADFIFTVGARYPDRGQVTDTSSAWKHVPFFEYRDVTAFANAIPRGCVLVGLECDAGLELHDLRYYTHPERAIYLLGAEDMGLPRDAIDLCRDELVEIPTSYCLNVATTGSIVLYDRMQKVASR